MSTSNIVSDYAAVVCNGDVIDGHPTTSRSCGRVLLSEPEYERQMRKADLLWSCPKCGSTALFDDGYYEERHGVNDMDYTK